MTAIDAVLFADDCAEWAETLFRTTRGIEDEQAPVELSVKSVRKIAQILSELAECIYDLKVSFDKEQGGSTI